MAVTYYVNGGCATDGNGSAPDCAVTAGGAGARITIQSAIDAAAGGDTVKVAPYSAYTVPNTVTTTTYYENIIVTKEITLELYTGNGDVCTADCPSNYLSSNPCLSDCKNWDIRPKHLPPASSRFLSSWIVINGDKTGDKLGDNGNATVAWSGGVGGTLRYFTVMGGYSAVSGNPGAGLTINGENTDVLVDGLQIRNNDNGITVRYGATPLIKGCYISANQKSAIAVQEGSAPIIGGGNDWNAGDSNKIFGNGVGMTGAECFSGGGITDCEQSRAAGCAAVAILDASSPIIWGNQVYSNYYTGIVALQQSTPSIEYNTISNNGRVGIGLLSVGQGIEASDNWITGNERGIGVQSSGDPCGQITLKNNDIANNSLGGIATCNAYVQIGGLPGEGNKIYNNTGPGIFLALSSDAKISNNNILNNYYSGIKLFSASATIEQNLIADNSCAVATNNKCSAMSSRQYGQIELEAGTAKRINHNIIIGGNYSGGTFEGIGISAEESALFPGQKSTLEEVRDNIIYRVGLGIKLSGDGGYGSVSQYRLGAVDKNLVLHWGNSALDTDGIADGYLLGGNNQPGENTYYYGQQTGAYSNPAKYIFLDPDHELPARDRNNVYPDFKLAADVNSAVYSISDYAVNSPVEYLGVSAGFKYFEEDRGALTIIGAFPEQVDEFGQPLPANQVKLADYHRKISDHYNGMALITYGGGNPEWVIIDDYIKSTNIAVVSQNYTVHPQKGERYAVIKSEFSYKFQTPALAGLTPTADGSAPTLAQIIPENGALNVPCNQIITIYLHDTGDGINSNSVQVSLGGGAGACTVGNCALVSGDNGSHLKITLIPVSALSPNTVYTVTVSAQDLIGNSLNTATTFTTVAVCEAGDTTAPQIDGLIPYNQQANVATSQAIQFNIRDTGSGVDADTIHLEIVDNGVSVPVTPEKTPLSDGSGSTPDYFVYYKPKAADGFINDKFGYGKSYSLNIEAMDCDNNLLTETTGFTITSDNVFPVDVTKLQTQVKGNNQVKLNWIPSENLDCDIAGYPYTLYVDSGNGYGSGQALTNLLYNADNYTITNLSDGNYNFKLTVKDGAGNESPGTEINNVLLITSTEFSDNFEGFYDDFAGDLSKWVSPGTDWSITGGELQFSGATGQTTELVMANLERSDYNYTAKIKINSGNTAWLLLRKISGSDVNSSGYLAKIGVGTIGNIGIYAITATGTKTLETGNSSSAISAGVWYNVKLKVEGNTLKLYLNTWPNPADILQVMATDSENDYNAGQIGLWHSGTGSVSYDDVRIDYNDGGGLYRYTETGSGWSHEAAVPGQAGNILRFTGAGESELLIDPLALAESYIYKAKVNITGGSVGLLANKSYNSAIGSDGYLFEIAPGSANNVKYYQLLDPDPSQIASYTINSNTQYALRLIKRSSDFEFQIDQNPVINVSNAASSNAAAGLYASAGAQADFDDLAITADLSEVGADTTITSNYTYAQIQAAISASSPGYSVIFSAGTYNIGANTLRMKKGVNLKANSIAGCGAKTVTVKGTNILITAADNASVEGFKLTGVSTNTGIMVVDASTTIENNEIVSCYDGVRVGGGSQTVSAPIIKNNCIHHNTNNGIANGFESTAIITGNQIYNNYSNGIGVNDLAAPQIENNKISLNSQAGIANRGQSFASITQYNLIYSNTDQGIAIRSSAHPKIENNHIYGNLTDGIGVGCPDNEPGCITDATPVIQNNLIHSNMHSGIAVRSQAKPTIASNEIYNHIYTCMGVNCENSDHSFGASIRISQDAQPVLGHNNLHNNSYGISLDLNPAVQYTLSGLSITRNGIGLHIGGDSAITVENCTLYSNYKFGIGMYYSAHPKIRDNQIRYNGDTAGREGDYLKYMPGAGTGVGGIGLAVDTYPEIYNNTITGHNAQILVADDVLPSQTGLGNDRVKLGALASSVDDYYNGRSIYLLTGNGAPDVMYVIDYIGATKEAVLSSSFSVKPALNDRYRIFRENYGIGVRGNTRVAGKIPLIHDNTINDNLLGMAIGNRDSDLDTPNPEIYTNDIYDNGTGDCPADIIGQSCGGGIGNRAHSTANIHNNTIYNQLSYGDFGIGVKENAAPTIGGANSGFANVVKFNRIGIAIKNNAAPVISYNQINSNSFLGIGIGGDSTAAENTNPQIYGNLIYGNSGVDCPTKDNCGGGIGLRANSAGNIYGNTIYGHSALYNFGIGMKENAAPIIGGNSLADANIIRDNYDGIAVKAQSAPQIKYNYLKKNSRSGLSITGSAAPVVRNNEIYSNSFTGISVGDKTTGDAPNPQIYSNNIYNNAGTPCPAKDDCGAGIGMAAASYGNIYGNTIYGHTAENNNGIGIQGTAHPVIGGTDLSQANTLRNNYRGIGIQGNCYPTVKYNEIYENTRAGIGLNSAVSNNDLLILGNRIRRNSAFGIELLSGKKITLQSNYIWSHTAAGVTSDKGTDLTITGNEIYGNGSRQEADHALGITPDCGIRLSNTKATISSNNIHNNEGYGINVTSGNATDTVTISGNTVGGGPGLGNYYTGIGIGGFDVKGSNKLTVNINGNNTISYNGTDTGEQRSGGIGFYSFGGTAHINGNTLSYNRGSGPAAGAIGIREINGGTINIGTVTGNTIFANIGGTPALAYRRCSGIGGYGGTTGTVNIANNEIYNHTLALSGADGGGIGFDEVTFSPAANIGPNNHVYNNDRGIRMNSVNNVVVANNIVTSNGNGTELNISTITPPDAGIRVITGNNITIRYNTMQGNNGYGVMVADLGSAQTVSILGNTIGGTAGKGNKLTGIGIGKFLAANSGTVNIGDGTETSRNTISYNGGFAVNDLAGGIAVKDFAGTANINKNTISNNVGVNAAGGIGCQGAGSSPGFNIANNSVSNNSGELIQNGIAMGNLGGAKSITVGPANTIDDGIIFSNSPAQTVTISQNSSIEVIGIKSLANALINNNTLITGGVSATGNTGVTISSNTISITDSIVTTTSGISLLANGNSVISSNNIHGVTGTTGAGYYGLKLDSNNSTASITGNTIKYFKRSGIRAKDFTLSGNLTIQNNTISSCGVEDYIDPVSGYRDASGIQLQNSTIANNKITGNAIYYNKFSGISAYNVDGIIGPNNTVKFNGNTSSGGGGCNLLYGPGSGDGGMTVRDLDTLDVLQIDGNTIADNNIGSVTRIKDCTGTVTLNGQNVACGQAGGYWDTNDAVVFVDDSGVYVNSVKISATPTVDCAANPSIPDNITGGTIWGIALQGNVSGAIVRNCNIYNNNTACNTRGLEGSNIGGGIFVGPNVQAQIYSNTIRYNGCEVAANGEGGSAGVAIRCSGADTVLTNNIIASNKSDGIDARDGAGIVGVSGAKNYIRYNGRLGVGMAGSTALTVAYNDIYKNGDSAPQGVGAGIGIRDSASPYIHHNQIYSNIGFGIGHRELSVADSRIYTNQIRNNQDAGIGFDTFAGTTYIEGNSIYSNGTNASSDSPQCSGSPTNLIPGGIGIKSGNNFSAVIRNNQIYNHRRNNQSSIGVIDSNPMDVTISSNQIHHNALGIMFTCNDGGSMDIRNNDIYSILGDTCIGFQQAYDMTVDINNNTRISGAGGMQFKDNAYNTIITVDGNQEINLGDDFKFKGNKTVSVTNNQYIRVSGLNGLIEVSDNSGAAEFSNNPQVYVEEIKLMSQGESQGSVVVSNNMVDFENRSPDSRLHFKHWQSVNVQGNILKRNKATGGGKGAIEFEGNREVFITDNEIYSCDWTIRTVAAGAAQTADMYVERNYFHDNTNGLVLIQYARLYINNNIFANLTGQGDTKAMILNNNDNVYLYFNTFADNTNNALEGNTQNTANGDANYFIIDNIFWNNGYHIPTTSNFSPDVVDHNIFQGGCPSSGYYTCTNTITADPLLNSARHLQNNSPALNEGVAVSPAAAIDVDGDSRPYGAGYDIGADECPACTPPTWYRPLGSAAACSEQSGNKAGNTIDGSTTTYWQTGTGDSTRPHWIYYDLSQKFYVTQVRVYFGTAAGNWNVYVSDSTTAWGTAVVTGWNPSGSGWQSSPAFYKGGRYIKLEVTNREVGASFFYEFQYAKGTPPAHDELDASLDYYAQISNKYATTTASAETMLRFSLKNISNNPDNSQVKVKEFHLGFVGTVQNSKLSQVKLYRDYGAIGVYEPGTDIQVTGSAFTWTSGTSSYDLVISSPYESVGTAYQHYLVIANISATVNSQIQLKLNATPADTPDGILIDTAGAGDTNDSINSFAALNGALVTIVNEALTVSDAGQTPISDGQVDQGTKRTAALRFQMQVTTGTGTVTVTTVNLIQSGTATSSNFDSIQLYRDAGILGRFDGAEDTYVGDFSWSASTQSYRLTGLTETVGTTAQNYLVVFDIAATTQAGRTVMFQTYASSESPAGVLINTATGDVLNAHSRIPDTAATFTVTGSTWNIPTAVTYCGQQASYPASNTKDNSTSTEWRSDTNNEQHWIEFDLGAAYTVSKLRFYAGTATRKWDVYMGSSSNPSSPQVVNWSTGGTGSSGWYEIAPAEAGGASNVRYIRFVYSNDNVNKSAGNWQQVISNFYELKWR
ncbi:MAG: right-handed parallel beta-helix repeat-containing protein [Candidatus Schekmanbacteria bacterium]|nr:right-handed parallel beta-helix repeat-containing protein [Candidatus Schekmanbacteria bacterium]